MLALQQLASQQPQTIVVESRANKCHESKAKFNNNMLQLLLIRGEVVLLPPALFDKPRIPTYTQAMKNILAMPTSIRAIQAVNILSTVFAEIPLDMAERPSPLMTHKSLYHISKNFTLALLSCNVQRTGLDSMNFEKSSITILSFVEQSNIAKLKAHREAEQITKNERKFNFIESHRKGLKTTIEGLCKITSMECIVKICANVFCIITAFFDIRPGNPIPLLYSICIKTIEFIKNLDFICWHAEVCKDVPQLPYIFFKYASQGLSQLAIFSTNVVNNNLVGCSDNGSNIIVTSVMKITKFVSRFFGKMDNHILEGSFPDSVPNFTPRDANPKHQAISATAGDSAGKIKSKTSPPRTPAHKRTSKKQKVKTAARAKDFTKAGLFHCKEGTPISELFPSNLSKKYCSFFCFHNKKCPKPKQTCNFEHIRKWDKIHADDQSKILVHCHATQGTKVWLNAETFAKHKATVPDKFVYLLGDGKGPKSA